MSITKPPKQFFSTSVQNPYESRFGYLRAVRSGPFVFVSGTTAVKPASVLNVLTTVGEKENEMVERENVWLRQDAEADADAEGESSDGGKDGSGSDSSDSQILFARDAKRQAGVAMQRCIWAVEGLGGCKADVCRVRMYVKRHEDCDAVGQAFNEYFGVTAPSGLSEGDAGAAATMIVMKDGFVDYSMLVEVEVDAVVL